MIWEQPWEYTCYKQNSSFGRGLITVDTSQARNQMDLFSIAKNGNEKKGKEESPFFSMNYMFCFLANAIDNAGIDCHTAHNRCNAKKVVKKYSNICS